MALKWEESQELETIEGLFPKKRENNETKSEIDEIRIWEEKNKRKGFIYVASKYKYDFQQYETIRSYGEIIYTGKINTD